MNEQQDVISLTAILVTNQNFEIYTNVCLIYL